VTYYTRTIKPGRKIREFDTLTPDESIRGGINPGEVIEHKFSVACYKLNGNEALLHQLPPDTVLEVSTDKIIWIPVRFVGQERQLPGVSRQNDDLLKGGF
jgi:hypothetical protein